MKQNISQSEFDNAGFNQIRMHDCLRAANTAQYTGDRSARVIALKAFRNEISPVITKEEWTLAQNLFNDVENILRNPFKQNHLVDPILDDADRLLRTIADKQGLYLKHVKDYRGATGGK